MSMKERMHTGELYLPGDKEIMKEQLACLNLLYDFNMTRPTELEKREKMLQKMFAEIGEGCYIEPPLHTNFGGAHVHFGKNVYANFNLTLVDDTHIYVGDNTMFGPGVIGAGSVVTKDIPSDVVAVGNPCRVLRPVGERDKEFYFKQRRIDFAHLQKDLEE